MMRVSTASSIDCTGSQLGFSRRGNALVGQKMFEILELARELEAKGEHVYHLELGNPRYAPPVELVEATLLSLHRSDFGYTYAAGHPVLRQAIAGLYSQQNLCEVNEGEVIVSPANLIINQFLDLTCDAGDTLVLFTPAFPTYWAAASHNCLRVKEVELNPESGFELRDEDVDLAIAARPRAIIVNSANNPTGAVYRGSVLERLAWLCDSHGIWLLSDETYGAISFGRPFHSLAGRKYPGLIVMSSFSKIFSVPGFRIGFALAAPEVAAKLALSNSTLISCLPIFTQIGCAAAVAKYHAYAELVKKRCAGMAVQCAAQLESAAHIGFGVPHAGFYFFLDIGYSEMDDLTFSRRLLYEHQTAVTPGSSFGPAYSRFVRIATCGLEEDVVEGTRRLTELLR